MSKKKSYTYDDEKANTPLARFLRERVNDPQRLAKYLGCSIQAVNQYKNGTAFPKVENLIKISKYYGVSLDYLVGKPSNDEVSTLVSYGFSLQAAAKLMNECKMLRRFDLLNSLIEQEEFVELIDALGRCKTLYNHEIPFKELLDAHVALLKKHNEYDEKKRKHFDTVYKIVPGEEAIQKDGVIFEPQHIMAKIAERFVNESKKEGNDAINTKENE